MFVAWSIKVSRNIENKQTFGSSYYKTQSSIRNFIFVFKDHEKKKKKIMQLYFTVTTEYFNGH